MDARKSVFGGARLTKLKRSHRVNEPHNPKPFKQASLNTNLFKRSEAVDAPANITILVASKSWSGPSRTACPLPYLSSSIPLLKRAGNHFVI